MKRLRKKFVKSNENVYIISYKLTFHIFKEIGV